MTGRLGAIFGIVVFGMLIDQNCSMMFYLLAVLLSSMQNNLNMFKVITKYINTINKMDLFFFFTLKLF